jgi:hypothetical protein
MIGRGSGGCGGREATLRERVGNARTDLVDRAERVDLDDEATILVDRDERSGLALVERLPVTDRLLGVV